jgi:tetratricopeptide (TPR) repeat protein
VPRTAPQAADSANDTVLNSRYQRHQELARGGMGVVYRVFDTYVEHVVALKRLVVSEERMRARVTALFEEEYDTLTQLAHPGIVEAYDYGIDAQGPFYTMELLEGGDLRQAAPLTVAETCRIGRAVASALALVHARRLVYRDLSPSNVRLTRDGHAKLIDFGALTPFGVPKEVVGTAAFMAPECLRRVPIDMRTDLYALGALLYWCLTSTHAVQVRSLVELPDALTLPIRPPSALQPEVPGALDELILALLSHDPLARPGSAAEVMHRLTAIAALPAEEHAERVAFSYLTRPPLVGRSEQLALLTDKFELSLQSRGQAVLLQGAQGLGRSALSAQLGRHAQRAGASVLRAQVGAQCGPFGIIRPLMRAALAMAPSLAEVHPMAAEFCSPRPEDAAPARSAAEAADRQARISASLQACLLDFSRLTPAVIVVDDVQRADAESLGMLVALAREAATRPLLLVTTSASDEAPSQAHAHERLVEESFRITLTPLDAEHLASLTMTVFGAAPNHRRLAMWLHRHGGGNPARCMALTNKLLQRGEIEYVTGTFTLPYDVNDDGLLRGPLLSPGLGIAQLDAEVRKTAELLCVFDEAVSLEELAKSAEQSTKQLTLALAELSRLAIVRRIDGCFAFAQDALRSAVVASTDPARLVAVHLRVAQTLLATPHASLDARRRASHHLLLGNACDEGLLHLTALAPELARSPEALGKAVPTLERALVLHNERGSSESTCMPLLVPLTLAGYYRDPKLLAPYIARSLESLLAITGSKLALRLQRFLSKKLALAIGLFYGRLYYAFAKHLHMIPFMDVLNALFAVAGTGAAAACAAFDFALAERMGQALAPFGALSKRHPANLVREYCLTTARSRIGPLAPTEATFEGLMDRLRPEASPALDHEVRTQVMVGALYAGGMVKLLRANTNGLAIADKMDAQDRAFYRPHAELLRMLHYAMRGEQHLAEPHRERTELLALLDGSGWSAVNNTAHRSILVYQWTQDSINLLRVIADLKRFAAVNDAVDPHLHFAEAYVELLRGRAEHALAIYEQVFTRFPTPCFWTWVGERGRYAEALNYVGQHAKARRICQETLRALSDDERVYRFLTHVVEQQLAVAEARLNDCAGAARRLETLLAEVEASENPLLIGSLHRDRAHVAMIARDAPAFEQHLAAMALWFRATKNPALIQQCERSASEGLKAGLPVPWLSTTALLDPVFGRTPANDGRTDPDCTAFLSEAELPPQRGSH